VLWRRLTGVSALRLSGPPGDQHGNAIDNRVGPPAGRADGALGLGPQLALASRTGQQIQDRRIDGDS